MWHRAMGSVAGERNATVTPREVQQQRQRVVAQGDAVQRIEWVNRREGARRGRDQ